MLDDLLFFAIRFQQRPRRAADGASACAFGGTPVDRAYCRPVGAARGRTLRRACGHVDLFGVLRALNEVAIVRRHVDAELIAAVRAAGGATYRTHGLGYVLRRTDAGHTWQADLDDLRARAAQVTPGFWPGRLMEV